MARVTRSQRGPGRRGGGGGGHGVVLGYHFPSLTMPPPGTFDPGLESQARATQRGLLDAIERGHIEGRRQRVDVGLKRRELGLKAQRGYADLSRNEEYARQNAAYSQQQLHTSFARDIEDLSIAKQRGEQDYQRTLTDMQHRYASTAVAQRERSIQQGVDEGGSNAATTAVRGANQAFDANNLATAHQRAVADLAQREGRINADYATQSAHIGEGLQRQLTGYGTAGQRLGQDVGTAQHALSLSAARATMDRSLKLSHAKREQAIYQTDVGQQAYYQAHQFNPGLVFPHPAGTPGGGGFHPRNPGGPPGTPHVHNAVPRVRSPRGITRIGRGQPAY